MGYIQNFSEGSKKLYLIHIFHKMFSFFCGLEVWERGNFFFRVGLCRPFFFEVFFRNIFADWVKSMWCVQNTRLSKPGLFLSWDQYLVYFEASGSLQNKRKSFLTKCQKSPPPSTRELFLGPYCITETPWKRFEKFNCSRRLCAAKKFVYVFHFSRQTLHFSASFWWNLSVRNFS